MKKHLFTTIPILLAGCATSYQPQSYSGGFSDKQLEPDKFVIVFDGNGYTSAGRARDMAFLRASELVLEHGFTHFAVIKEQNEINRESFTTNPTAHTTTTGTIDYSGRISAQSTTTYRPGYTYTYRKPASGLVVRGFKDKPEENSYDAASVRHHLTNYYRIQLNPAAIVPSTSPKAKTTSIRQQPTATR